jgi:hypothetical protein
MEIFGYINLGCAVSMLQKVLSPRSFSIIPKGHSVREARLLTESRQQAFDSSLLVSDIIGFPTWLFLLLGRCEAAGRLLGMSEQGSRASTRRIYLQGSCRAFLAYEMLQPVAAQPHE